MPSTRSTAPVLATLPNDFSDDDYDPDYRESSDDDSLPPSNYRDRAKWIEDNVDDIEWLYRKLLEDGRSVFGRALLQCGDITKFANFLYRYTTPLSESA